MHLFIYFHFDFSYTSQYLNKLTNLVIDYGKDCLMWITCPLVLDNFFRKLVYTSRKWFRCYSFKTRSKRQ